jgi:predicted nuclease of predicted toxin-antitoxin system
MTKEGDFIQIIERAGPPSQIIWVTTSNRSNVRFTTVLKMTFPDAISLISNGEPMVEIQQSLQNYAGINDPIQG